jgi:anaerobic magnesium-protoporphyrin IX monomethyl ester cyclase
MTHAPLALCLVGPNQQENLGLQYVASSAEHAGHHAELVGFDSRRDIPTVARFIVERQPMAVGLGMAFQYAVNDYLELAQALRHAGYNGHLTAGGHVATFCWRELLDTCTALDSIVLHEGERPIIGLLDRLRDAVPIVGTPGCASRDGDTAVLGPPAPPVRDLDELAHPLRSDKPYLVAGIPVAFCLTARGCVGECAYCCVRAFAAASGAPRFRLRSANAVGRELGELRARGIRIVFVQDDLFILPDERRAIERLESLRRACEVHGASGLVWWVKGRPESVTPRVVEAARALGATHLFLGIENPVQERLAYLGRRHRPEDNRRALDLCREGGLYTSFNLMMFDPDCSLAHVSETVDFGAQHPDIPWNVCRTEIYPGTALFQRLQGAGRLDGDFRSWGYRMLDERAELAFRILRSCLHERAFSSESLLNKLISLAFGMQAQQTLLPGTQTDTLARQVDELGRTVRQDTVDLLRRVIDFARRAAGADARSVTRFAVEEALSAGARDAPWHDQVDRLWDVLHARGRLLLQTDDRIR